MRSVTSRLASATLWAYLVWILLTWTWSAENLLVGLGVAAAVGAAVAATGAVVAPWRLLRPRRWWAMLRLMARVAARIVVQNIRLARRIWAPSRPLSSGMVVVPTRARSDGEIAVVGLATSLIVDTQIIDLDRTRQLLQFHGVALPTEPDADIRARINGPVERDVLMISRR